MVDYTAIYNKMEADVWYKASDLGVAAASMTAMIKRGLVEKQVGKPMKYRKLNINKSVRLMEYAKQEGVVYFILYHQNSERGMLCSFKSDTVIDCWNKTYDLATVNRMEVYKKGVKTEYILDN